MNFINTNCEHYDNGCDWLCSKVSMSIFLTFYNRKSSSTAVNYITLVPLVSVSKAAELKVYILKNIQSICQVTKVVFLSVAFKRDIFNNMFHCHTIL